MIELINKDREIVAPRSNIRALKSGWTLDVQQDLEALHGGNVTNELIKSLAFEIQEEIDNEISSQQRNNSSN